MSTSRSRRLNDWVLTNLTSFYHDLMTQTVNSLQMIPLLPPDEINDIQASGFNLLDFTALPVTGPIKKVEEVKASESWDALNCSARLVSIVNDLSELKPTDKEIMTLQKTLTNVFEFLYNDIAKIVNHIYSPEIISLYLEKTNVLAELNLLLAKNKNDKELHSQADKLRDELKAMEYTLKADFQDECKKVFNKLVNQVKQRMPNASKSPVLPSIQEHTTKKPDLKVAISPTSGPTSPIVSPSHFNLGSPTQIKTNPSSPQSASMASKSPVVSPLSSPKNKIPSPPTTPKTAQSSASPRHRIKYLAAQAKELQNRLFPKNSVSHITIKSDGAIVISCKNPVFAAALPDVFCHTDTQGQKLKKFKSDIGIFQAQNVEAITVSGSVVTLSREAAFSLMEKIIDKNENEKIVKEVSEAYERAIQSKPTLG